jgi:hypothetical protein
VEKVYRLLLLDKYLQRIPWEGILEYHSSPTAGAPIRILSTENEPPTNTDWRGGPVVLSSFLPQLTITPVDLVPSDGEEFLLISDPRGDLTSEENDPQGICKKHIQAIRRRLTDRGYTVTLFSGHVATATLVSDSLERPEVAGVYYFGHASLNGEGEGGLLLRGEETLTLHAIRALNTKAKLIFLNACEGGNAIGMDLDTGDPFSLAEAFNLDNKTRAAISPIYPVVNVQAARFAETFFENACEGCEGMDYIHALGKAREESWEHYEKDKRPDTAWISYRYFGNPSLSLPPPGVKKRKKVKSCTNRSILDSIGSVWKWGKVPISLIVAISVLASFSLVNKFVCPSREIMRDICPCVMEQNASNAFVDTYLGPHEPLVEPLPTYFLSSQSPSDATSATIQGVSLQLPPLNLRERAKAFHYVSEIRKRKDHWGMVLFWAAGRKYPFLPRSLSAEGEQHLLLTIYSTVDETIRIGFKDVTQNEKKVSLPLKQGWATYIVPLSYFEPVDLNRFTLFSLAHEEKYANHEEIQLEVLNISFDTLEIPKI